MISDFGYNLLFDEALPDVWGEGALFAFSGMDGQTNEKASFVASLGADNDLIFHLSDRRILKFHVSGPVVPQIILNDLLILDCDAGRIVVAWSDWHTVVGQCPSNVKITLTAINDEKSSDEVILHRYKEQFAVSFGKKLQEAELRTQTGLNLNVDEIVASRLNVYEKIDDPSLDKDARKLRLKCFSVMKVNSLAPESPMTHRWSTPDRVPHRAMWLWDSVFHSLGMNYFDSELAGEYLLAVLQQQRENGMIPHMFTTCGYCSVHTQPPVLAWGVWENYLHSKNRGFLENVYTGLERYLQWNLENRDTNNNGVFEWYIEGDPFCRCGESGMDNSPRFDEDTQLDAVDFSTFMAHDAGYLSKIAFELGNNEDSEKWSRISRRISSQIHSLLWNEEKGFYCDRKMDGRFSSVLASSGFLPLLLEDIPKDRVLKLIQALEDPMRFGSDVPVASISLDSPKWSTDMWRGPSWININYLIVRGLTAQNCDQQAEKILHKSLEIVGKYYNDFGVTFEYYDSRNQTYPTNCDRKGPVGKYDIRDKIHNIRDYHWTAALTFAMLNESETRITKKQLAEV